jgi:hypothetical protein
MVVTLYYYQTAKLKNHSQIKQFNHSLFPLPFSFYNAKTPTLFLNLHIPQRDLIVRFILIPLLTVTMFASFWRSIDRFSVQHFK